MQNALTLSRNAVVPRPRYARPVARVAEESASGYRIDGVHGHLTLMRHCLIITRKPRLGFLGGSFSIPEEKLIVLKNIEAVELKQAGTFSHCQIRFLVSAMVEAEQGDLYRDPDENSLSFRGSDLQYFYTLKAYVESVLRGEPLDFDTLVLSRRIPLMGTIFADLATA
jgi:hypothetical protein